MISSAFLSELLAWNEIRGVVIPCASNKIFVRRVSSQITKSADFKISTARNVMSCKFPIGVETTASIFAIFDEILIFF